MDLNVVRVRVNLHASLGRMRLRMTLRRGVGISCSCGGGGSGGGSSGSSLTAFVTRPTADDITLEGDGPVDVMQLVVEAAGVAQDLARVVLAPERGQGGLAVGAHGLRKWGHRSPTGGVRATTITGGITTFASLLTLLLSKKGSHHHRGARTVLGLVAGALSRAQGLLKVLGTVHGMQLVIETTGVAERFVVGRPAPEGGDGRTTVVAADVLASGGLDRCLGGLTGGLGHLVGWRGFGAGCLGLE